MHTSKRKLKPTHTRQISYAADNLPTAERLSQGIEVRLERAAVDDPRQVLRIHSGLAQLLDAGKIGMAEVNAANRWRSDYELGEHGARDPEKSGSGGGVDGYNISAIDALTRYRSACRAIGMIGDCLLRAFVSDGLSFRAMAAKLGRDNRDLSAQTALVLEILAEHYADVDSNKAPPAWEASRIRAAGRAA